MSSKILFCGDTHGQLQHIVKAVKVHDPAAVILLGDVQTPSPLHIELEEILQLTDVWYIHGNHDTDSDTNYDNLFESELGDRNLHGRVVEIAGFKIAGIGGIFRGKVWMPPNKPLLMSRAEYANTCGKGNLWRGGIPRKHRSTIFPEDFAGLADQKADVLVMHEAPSCHPHGFEVIDSLARNMGVRVCYHGHHHESPDYKHRFPGMGFECYGVELRGIHILE